MKAEDLISAYSELLSSLGLTVVDNYIQFNDGEKAEAVMCEGRRLVLPSREVLTSLNNKTQIAFHPLSESVVRGESPVLVLLRKMVAARLFGSLSLLSMSVLGIAMDSSRHSSLTPAGKAILRRIPEILPDCHDQYEKIIKHIADSEGKDNTARLVTLYIKRNAKLEDETFKRACIVNFPIMKELDTKGDKVFGKTIKTKNKAIIAELLRYIIDEEGNEPVSIYSKGSHSYTATGFQSLLFSYAALANRINEVANLYKKPLGDVLNRILIDTSWLEKFQDLSVYNGLIPSLDGNEGTVPEKPVNKQAVTQPVQQVNTPTPTPTPEQETKPSGGFVVAPINNPVTIPSSRGSINTGLNTSNTGNSDPVAQWTGFINNAIASETQRNAPQYGMPLVGQQGGFNTGFNTGFNNQPSYPGRGFVQQANHQQRVYNNTISMPLTDGSTSSIVGSSFNQPSQQQRGNRNPFGV